MTATLIRRELRRSLSGLAREGFRKVIVLRGVSEVDEASIAYERLFNDRRELAGPFDIIGDVHGCLDEVLELIGQLGYECTVTDGRYDVSHPQQRKLLFVGDLVGRRQILDLVQGEVQPCGQPGGGGPEHSQVTAVGGHREQHDVVPDRRLRMRCLSHRTYPPDGRDSSCCRSDAGRHVDRAGPDSTAAGTSR